MSFEAIYGKIPSIDAAAGATLGVLLNRLVVAARSTDSSRLLRARAKLDGDSFWASSPLSFRDGEQDNFLPYVVLLDGGKPMNIWPFPSNVKALRLSVPPAASR